MMTANVVVCRLLAVLIRFDSGGRGPKRDWLAPKTYRLHYRRTLTASRDELYQRWIHSHTLTIVDIELCWH